MCWLVSNYLIWNSWMSHRIEHRLKRFYVTRALTQFLTPVRDVKHWVDSKCALFLAFLPRLVHTLGCASCRHVIGNNEILALNCSFMFHINKIHPKALSINSIYCNPNFLVSYSFALTSLFFQFPFRFPLCSSHVCVLFSLSLFQYIFLLIFASTSNICVCRFFVTLVTYSLPLSIEATSQRRNPFDFHIGSCWIMAK